MTLRQQCVTWTRVETNKREHEPHQLKNETTCHFCMCPPHPVGSCRTLERQDAHAEVLQLAEGTDEVQLVLDDLRTVGDQLETRPGDSKTGHGAASQRFICVAALRLRAEDKKYNESRTLWDTRGTSGSDDGGNVAHQHLQNLHLFTFYKHGLCCSRNSSHRVSSSRIWQKRRFLL